MVAGCAVNTTTKARLKQNDVMKYRQIDASEAALWRAASGGSASAAGVDPE